MAARRAPALRSTAGIESLRAPDPAAQPQLTKVVEAIRALQQTALARNAVTVSLVVGTNKVQHGLGRAYVGYTVTPTFATVAFGHAVAPGNPRPDLEVWIDVVGSAQPNAVVEVF